MSEVNSMNPGGTITSLLARVRTGDKPAADQLFDYVYTDLKRLARSLIAERAFSPTAAGSTSLVNAACERLLAKGPIEAADRRHFYFQFIRAMRDVLVEQARFDLAAKRGGGRRPVPLTDIGVEADTTGLSILDVQAALDELEKKDPDATEVVMLRFYGGRTLAEIAEIRECTLAMVRRDWEYARAWLHERLSDPDFEATLSQLP